MRAVEAAFIALVTVIFLSYALVSYSFTTPSQHEVTAERAYAYLILNYDYLNEQKLVNFTKDIGASYVEIDGDRYELRSCTNCYPVRFVWLGYNRTYNPRVVVVGVEP